MIILTASKANSNNLLLSIHIQQTKEESDSLAPAPIGQTWTILQRCMMPYMLKW